MEKPIIQVKNIGKKYNINHQKGGYITLRDKLTNVFVNPFSFLRNKIKQVAGIGTKEEFWALKDINFEIKKGEVVGIVGQNGAGKSTLLKILSQITPPTTGEIKIHGTVGSLLEVGTGFHPELTGRENIFLNGAILGIKKKDIIKKFEKIVEFAGIEKFLDTPVKYYSSGMYVRLAFSVAAHMETDILIIDEVLAVGDAEFQKKCLGKMEDITKNQGRTILFVSHNMEAIQKLCNRLIILQKGNIIFDDLTEKGISFYLNSGIAFQKEKIWDKKQAPGDSITKIYKIFSHTEEGVPSEEFDITKKIGITIEYEVFEDNEIFTHGLNVFNEEGINIFNSHDTVSKIRLENRKKGLYASTVWIPGNFLAEGTISIGVALFKTKPFVIHAQTNNSLIINIIDNVRGDSARGNYTLGFPGIIRPLLIWETNKINQ
jgi:lipopolysaccharide transport system ATP-binding protein